MAQDLLCKPKMTLPALRRLLPTMNRHVMVGVQTAPGLRRTIPFEHFTNLFWTIRSPTGTDSLSAIFGTRRQENKPSAAAGWKTAFGDRLHIRPVASASAAGRFLFGRPLL